MSAWTREDLQRRFGRSDDPEIEARRRWILEVLLEDSPEVNEQLVAEGIAQGRLKQARAGLRRVLARRGLALSAALETQIDGCSELTTLHQWHEQAVTAASAEDALA